MRIISGKYKGKKIDGFDIEGTRPTMDRVKESIFASIQDYIKGTCLDLFAGSGNLGIEALSNGCNKAYFVDNNKNAIKVINNNIKNIEEHCILLNMDYLEAVKKLKEENIKFDLIFLDPPYNKKILNDIITKIYDIVNLNGVVVLEYEEDNIETYKYNVLKEKKYGKKFVTVLQKKI